MSLYLDALTENLRCIEEKEAKALSMAADAVADVICREGLIFTFGCGHSHLPGLDAFYRAGGLANVSPMLDTDLMLHNGAAKSSRMEKMSGLASEICRRYLPTKNDLLFVFSASGKNQVPYEMALAARERGATVIGISSSSYFEKGGKLHTAVDLHIDCHVPYGDAAIEVGAVKMGGLSTSAACFILNSVLIEEATRALARGKTPPIYISGNVEGGREYNAALEELYLPRVKHL